jgi:peptidoglycan/xylan/chitin deacetylase (PgdA/CDA1 family)
MLSICFDDFPHSAAISGAEILERFDARGTFYAAAGMAGKEGPCGPGFTPRDLHTLHVRGHEIGCHGFGHLDCARLDVFDALRDIACNRDALSALGHTTPLASFAYPYGETSLKLKQTLPPRFSSARGIAPGLNDGNVDLAQLHAFPLYGEGGLNRARKALKQAKRKKAWVIAFTHDISENPSPFGTKPEDLRVFIEAAQAHGFCIAPVSEVLSHAELTS